MNLQRTWLGRRLTRLSRHAWLPLASSLAVLFASLAWTAAADASANAIEPLAGCMANTLEANDDGSTALVPLGFTANFYGTPHTEVYVNNNGNVTFNEALSTYTPFDFTAVGYQIIAPYLADVDTRAGEVVHYGSGEANGEKYFCVNWVNVGYYSEHTDKLNSFQMILWQAPGEAYTGSETSGNFKIEFNYDSIQWETGDASGGSEGFGGTPAAVGFSANDGVRGHYDVFSGSFESGAFEDFNGSTGLINNTLNAGGVLGRYIFDVTNSAGLGGSLKGIVYQHDGATPEGEASVQICPQGSAGPEGGSPGECVVRQTNSAGEYVAGGLLEGSYEVIAYPGGGSFQPSTAKTISIKSKEKKTENIVLGEGLSGPPEGTSLQTETGETGSGIPVLYWQSATPLTTHGCQGGTATVSVTAENTETGAQQTVTSTLTESPAGSGVYTGAIPPVYPLHGAGAVKIAITCPTASEDSNISFAIYIDPSGTVVNAAGAPVEGATVTLLRSSAGPHGPFVPVPQGNSEMSPANRTNPFTTTATGKFGWDVVAGYYEIKAVKEGCSAVSSVLTVPPPANGLVLTLCPAPSTTTSTTTTGGGSPPVVAKVATIEGVKAVAERNGSVKVTFRATGAGAATVSAKTRIKIPVKASKKKGKHHKKPKPRFRLIAYASGHTSATGAELVTITIPPSPKGKAELKALKKLRVSITVVFKPTSGASTTQATSVIVRYFKPKHHGKHKGKGHKK